MPQIDRIAVNADVPQRAESAESGRVERPHQQGGRADRIIEEQPPRQIVRAWNQGQYVASQGN